MAAQPQEALFKISVPVVGLRWLRVGLLAFLLRHGNNFLVIFLSKSSHACHTLAMVVNMSADHGHAHRSCAVPPGRQAVWILLILRHPSIYSSHLKYLLSGFMAELS